MKQADIKLRDNLIQKIKDLDVALLQRISDFMEGIAAASSIQTDWWDELPDSVKEGYHEGMKDIEEGNLIPMDEVMKRYRS